VSGNLNLTSRRDRTRLNLMQALEDAIYFRRLRATEACLDCDPDGTPCDDHACDLRLIGDYRRSLDAVIAGVVVTGGDTGLPGQ